LRIDSRELEQISDVPEQKLGIALDDGERSALRVQQIFRVEQLFYGTQDQGQWSAQLVTDIGEGMCLHLREFAQP